MTITPDRGRYLLPSLEVENYRLFRHLTIPRLERVNLIVGKNSVGKSCLLDSVRLFAERGSPVLLRELLEAREEWEARPPRAENTEDTSYGAIRHLFHGRKNVRENASPIRIGLADDKAQTLEMTIQWFRRELDAEGRSNLRYIGASGTVGQSVPFAEVAAEIEPGITIGVGGNGSRTYLLSRLFDSANRFWRDSSLLPTIATVNVAPQGLDSGQIAFYWDDLTLTDREQDVVRALGIIVPQIEAVNLVGAADRARRDVVKARLAGESEPLPLRSLGEGVNRLFGLALALVSAKDGVLLIDEVENGLHYSVQLAVWRLILATAERLNVQVFATTHSWDCVSAFQQALNAQQECAGLLVRLERRNGEIRPVLFEKDELAVADQQAIEIR